MMKLTVKYLQLIAVITVLTVTRTFAQTITIGTVDPGPYGPGSTIAVPFHIDDSGGCIGQANTFSLYMSDATGTFTSATPVATITGFYGTFFNVTLPTTITAGANYKFLIKSSAPAKTSNISNAISLSLGGTVVAAASSSPISATDTTVYGQCNGSPNAFTFFNTTKNATTVNATFFNELTQTAEATNVSITPSYTFNAKAANYTVTIRAVNSTGLVGTYAYQLINNVVSTSIGFTGNPTVCLSGGSAPLTYNIDYTSATGIQNNYPGNTYTFTWGDGSAATVLTLCQIKALSGLVTHSFSKVSCGNTANGQVNSFQVNFKAESPYCGQIGSTQTSYAKVVTAPTSFISAPKIACANGAVTFVNGSDPGPDPNATTSTCIENPNARYQWSVDGVVLKQNYTLEQNFIYTFTTTGTHYVTLHLQNYSGPCVATDYTDTICIQNPPKPIFILPIHTICLGSAPVTPDNASVIDSTCTNNAIYTWSVNGPAPVSYAGGTNANSARPQFVFSSNGIYTVRLGIAACDTVNSPVDTVFVNTTPTATLSPDFTSCGAGQTLSFSPLSPTSPTYTLLTGTAKETPTTYKWVVTPPVGGLPATFVDTAQYPKILFPSTGTYTITVTHVNSCGSVTATQHINFLAAPNVKAGNDTTICYNGQASLNGSITGAPGSVNSQQWTGGTGAFSPNRTALQATYIPSAAEVSAGQVTLLLVVATTSAAPCDTIRSPITIKITPLDTVTSANALIICSGQPLNYQIKGSVPNGTFSWTAAVTQGSASGFTNGTGNTINDVLTNTGTGSTAVVTYTIMPKLNGCPGKTFTLTVSLPDAVASFTASPTNGCGNLAVQFTNTSNAPAGTTYSWDLGDGTTSTATNPQHTFAQKTDGRDTSYIVSLSITNNCIQRAPVIDTITVRPATAIARILPQQTVYCSSMTLDVVNESPGNNVKYDFYLYQGATLVQQITKTDKTDALFNTVNPPKGTVYTLYMVATGYCNNTGESVHIPITVTGNNITSQTFVQNNNTKGCVPFTITLINNSSGGTNFHYNIYNSNNQIIDQPIADTAAFQYTFSKSGTYYVTLTAINACGSIESNPPIRIDVYSPPIPNFKADTTKGCKSVLISFTNLSTDTSSQSVVLNYDWDFGDGTAHSSALTPPPHLYRFNNSPYTVTLTATNPITGCSAALTKKAYINIIAPPGTNFIPQPDSVALIPNYHFEFLDRTTGSPIVWKWVFSDGQTSNLRNPQITFADTGIYKATLTTTNLNGCDSTASHFVIITGTPGELYLPNAFIPSSPTAELRVFMAKGSGIKVWLLQIFNKYGQLVWQTDKLDANGSPVEGWDGTYHGVPAPQGVYVWQASATFINGTEWKGMSYNNSLPARVGSVHLIR